MDNIAKFPDQTPPTAGIYKVVSLHDPNLDALYAKRVAEILKNQANSKTNAFAATFIFAEAETYRIEMHNTTRFRLDTLRFDREHGSSGFRVWSGNNSPLEMKYIIMSHFYENRATRKQGLVNSLFMSERNTLRLIRAAEDSEQIIVEKGQPGQRHTTIIKPSTRMIYEYEEHLEAHYLRMKERGKKQNRKGIYQRHIKLLEDYQAFKKLRDEKLPNTILDEIDVRKKNR